MVNTVRKNKPLLMAVFAFIAVCGTFLTLQSIHAQGQPMEVPPPGMEGAVPAPGGTPGGGGGGGSSAIPTEPEVTFGQVVHSGIAVSSKKNWDGRVFSSLKFKYKTVDGRTLTVILPAEYKSEKKTRAGWETLFVVYGMDTEIVLDQIEKAMPPDVSHFMGQLMAEIRGQASNRPAPDVISAAMEKAKAYLPSIGLGNMSLPPMLPGMP